MDTAEDHDTGQVPVNEGHRRFLAARAARESATTEQIEAQGIQPDVNQMVNHMNSWQSSPRVSKKVRASKAESTARRIYKPAVDATTPDDPFHSEDELLDEDPEGFAQQWEGMLAEEGLQDLNPFLLSQFRQIARQRLRSLKKATARWDAANEAPQPKPAIDLIASLCSCPELINHVCNFLRPVDIVTLYSVAKDFHNALNEYMQSTVMGWAREMAPRAARIYSSPVYHRWFICDPAGRRLTRDDVDMAQLKPGQADDRQIQHINSRVGAARYVPGLTWLQTVVNREIRVRDIIATLARHGHRLPKGADVALQKLWVVMDASASIIRMTLLASEEFFTDDELYICQMFFIKLCLLFNDPVFGPQSSTLAKLMLGQKGLSPLWALLRRKKYTTSLEIRQLKLRYDVPPDPEQVIDGTPVLGVEIDEMGIGHFEGWEHGNFHHLLRPDELISQEALRRGLRLDKAFLMMQIYGHVDTTTGNPMVPTVDEMYMSDDDQDPMQSSWTTLHRELANGGCGNVPFEPKMWKPKHARKADWKNLPDEVKKEIIEDDKIEMRQVENVKKAQAQFQLDVDHLKRLAAESGMKENAQDFDITQPNPDEDWEDELETLQAATRRFRVPRWTPPNNPSSSLRDLPPTLGRYSARVASPTLGDTLPGGEASAGSSVDDDLPSPGVIPPTLGGYSVALPPLEDRNTPGALAGNSLSSDDADAEDSDDAGADSDMDTDYGNSNQIYATPWASRNPSAEQQPLEDVGAEHAGYSVGSFQPSGDHEMANSDDTGSPISFDSGAGSSHHSGDSDRPDGPDPGSSAVRRDNPHTNHQFSYDGGVSSMDEDSDHSFGNIRPSRNDPRSHYPSDAPGGGQDNLGDDIEHWNNSDATPRPSDNVKDSYNNNKTLSNSTDSAHSHNNDCTSSHHSDGSGSDRPKHPSPDHSTNNSPLNENTNSSQPSVETIPPFDSDNLETEAIPSRLVRRIIRHNSSEYRRNDPDQFLPLAHGYNLSEVLSEWSGSDSDSSDMDTSPRRPRIILSQLPRTPAPDTPPPLTPSWSSFSSSSSSSPSYSFSTAAAVNDDENDDDNDEPFSSPYKPLSGGTHPARGSISSLHNDDADDDDADDEDEDSDDDSDGDQQEDDEYGYGDQGQSDSDSDDDEDEDDSQGEEEDEDVTDPDDDNDDDGDELESEFDLNEGLGSGDSNGSDSQYWVPPNSRGIPSPPGYEMPGLPSLSFLETPLPPTLQELEEAEQEALKAQADEVYSSCEEAGDAYGSDIDWHDFVEHPGRYELELVSLGSEEGEATSENGDGNGNGNGNGNDDDNDYGDDEDGTNSDAMTANAEDLGLIAPGEGWPHANHHDDYEEDEEEENEYENETREERELRAWFKPW